MEAFALYLFKSVIWLSGFAIVYFLFLRNERYFRLNRLYLVSGILISFFFPLFTIHYTVETPSIPKIDAGYAILTGVQNTGHGNLFYWELFFLTLYLTGILFVVLRTTKQSISVLHSIKKTGIIETHPVKLIRNTDYTVSFSFFSYVFVNPSVSDLETKEIVNHELVHIRQKHWVDLVLVELLCIMQWFNPLIWIYIRFIRQNHEYLADEVALQRTSDPAVYRATLLNQLAGYPVVSLANSFNYSLNKKRFKMMKNIVSSPWRKMKIFLILPVFAIVLYAFAKPDYRSKPGDNGSVIPLITTPAQQQKEIKGTVVQKDGEALPGAAIIITGTTEGTTTDGKGSFKLANVPQNASIVVSFVGFKTKVLKADFSSEMIIQMVRDTVKYTTGIVVSPPPPPVQLTSGRMNAPLIILDGKVTDKDVNSIPVETIESENVLSGKEAAAKYGVTGKDGVILITTKKGEIVIPDVPPPPPPPPPIPGGSEKTSKVEGSQSTDKGTFIMVEEMPQFPGGQEAMSKWLADNIKYPGEAVKKNITGQVFVTFMVTHNGKIKDVTVDQPVDPLLDAEAVRVVSGMPDWKPGSQGGKTVNVYMKIPINFNLK